MHFINKRIGYLFYIAVIIFFACNTTDSENGFKIDGELKNYANQTIYLDELSIIGDDVTIDTTTTDKDGEFQFKGSVKEKALYRLRLQNGVNYFLALDNEMITFNGDVQNPMQYEINGSPESFQLKLFLDKIVANNHKFDSMQQRYIKLQQMNVDDSTLMGYKNFVSNEATKIFTDVKTFIDTTHYDLCAIFATSLLSPDKDLAAIKKFDERLQKKSPNKKYAMDFNKKYERYVEDLVGKPFIDIEMADYTKHMIKLSELKGKWILLDFWASWCAPCREENPKIVALWKKLKGKNFDIFSVSLDKEDGKWYDAIKADKLDWKHHVTDLKGWRSKPCLDYHINQIPSNFLINPQGIIVAKDISAIDVEKAITKNLKQEKI